MTFICIRLCRGLLTEIVVCAIVKEVISIATRWTQLKVYSHNTAICGYTAEYLYLFYDAICKDYIDIY
jgi:hypothetical protein